MTERPVGAWTRVLAALLFLPGCLPFGTQAERVSYEGLDFELSCRPVEPDLIGEPLTISTNVEPITVARDIITLDARVAFAVRMRTGCGDGFRYGEDWFLVRSDELADAEAERIAGQVAPFAG